LPVIIIIDNHKGYMICCIPTLCRISQLITRYLLFTVSAINNLPFILLYHLNHVTNMTRPLILIPFPYPFIPFLSPIPCSLKKGGRKSIGIYGLIFVCIRYTIIIHTLLIEIFPPARLMIGSGKCGTMLL